MDTGISIIGAQEFNNKEGTMSKINSTEVPDKLRRSILRHGVNMDLGSITEVGRYLGYKEANFRNRVNKMSFNFVELRDLFRRLHYTQEEILEVMQ